MPRGGARPGAGRKTKGNHLNPAAINQIRAKIKSGAILRRLQQHIEGDADMAPSAVTAALGLLRKIVPDLSAMELSGDPENPVAIQEIARRVVDPKAGNTNS